MDSRALIIEAMDPPPAREEDWNDFYSTEHAPSLLAAGALALRRYVNMEGHPDIGIDTGPQPKYLAIYELPGLDVLRSDAFRALSKVADAASGSPEQAWGGLEKASRSVFELIFQYPEPGDYAFGDTKHIYFSGADCPPQHADEYNAYYNTEHIPLVFDEIPGFVTARRFRQVSEEFPPEVWNGGRATTHLASYDIESEKVFENPIFVTFTPTPWQVRIGGIRILRSGNIYREIYRAEA